MKRTEKKIETLENSGAKPKKTVASKTLKSEPPPAVAKKKTGVARAEKPVKNVKTKSSVKVSAKVSPAAPKSSKAVSAKTAEPKKAAAPKRKAAPVKETSAVKTKAVAAPKGAVSTPRSKKGAALISKPTPKKNATAKPVKKKIKPIGSAVVRGKNGKYDFEVFPLDADLKDGSGIYVISKRITDKSGRGHHKFVCIGQTESLLGEIKRHKKDKCIKQHSANVICLLREESATNRLKIETDLRAAHTIACNQK
jgi:hypothetical protein